MPPKVFISYRRSDSATIVGRIYDRLKTEFGGEFFFRDLNNINPGDKFRGEIKRQIALSDVVLVVIGDQWLNVMEGEEPNKIRRLDNPKDLVRYEVESALDMSPATRLIPVLVKGASMPNAKDLPLEISGLAGINGITVRDDPDFHGDMDKLIGYLKTLPGFAVLPTPVAMAPSPPAKPKKIAEIDETETKNEGCLRRGRVVINVTVVFLTLALASLALFSEEWRNDAFYKLGVYTATPTEIELSLTSNPTTEIPTVATTPPMTIIFVPTATDEPPAPTTQTPPTSAPIPTSAPVGNANLRLLVDTASFTLVVGSASVNLNGLQFAVTENGSTEIVALAELFNTTLPLMQGIAPPNACFVLNRPDIPAPALSGDCKDGSRVYRPNIALADVFWFDFVVGVERDIAIYRDGVSTGQICPAASTACDISFGLVEAAVPTKGYPCDGMIASSGQTLLNVVHEFPNTGSNIIAANSVRAGSSVRLLDDASNSGDIWYEIEQQSRRLGWIPDEYVVISGNCPG